MTAHRMRPAALLPAQTLIAWALVALTLAPPLMGRAGFQLFEEAVAARIFPLHRHGVPGEDAYIREHGQPAPFVHPHCHNAPRNPEEHTPAELSLAATVLGPVLCAAADAAPRQPDPQPGREFAEPLPPPSHTLRPPVPPPQG